MIDYKKDLNQEQLDVVLNAEGPCLVLAGAGSGKTRTITYRVAYLLEQGVSPENILLVTFTNKAARAMIERVAALVNHLTPGPSPWQGEGKPAILPWSGTFHHIAYRVLKKYATFLGYKNSFSVLDSDDSSNLIKQCLKDEGIDRTMKRFPSPSVLQSIISYSRNSEMTIEEVLNLKYEHFLPIADTIKHLASNYEKRKKAANVMDFDDLLLNWLVLLQQSEKIREKHQDQFHYVLVDEYQDTNKIQASIIRLIAQKHRNLLVVGDDAQSIYSFRAADVKNILDFEKEYLDAKIFKLETNYRSTPDILNLANDVISNNIKQYKKELRSVIEKFVKPEAKSFDESAGEALFVSDRIEELMNQESVSPEKIAVLFRAAHHSQALEMELMKRGIAYDYRGGIRFFERSHVKDVLAYLRILNNQTDEMAWRRVLGMQVGIGEVTIGLILERLRTYDVGPMSDDLPARAGIGWNDFLQIYNKLKDAGLPRRSSEGTEAGDVKVGDLIRILLESKYVEYLENEYPDYRERMQDLEQMAGFADKAESLDSFLAESSLQENFRTPTASLNNKIILSTIHQAKGLEWDAVFIINLCNGQFPNERALRENDGLDEERRLFYVAITRAKKYLHLTYSSASMFGGFQGGPSMFLEEIDRELVDMEGEGTVFNDGDGITYVAEDAPPKKRTGFLSSIDEL